MYDLFFADNHYDAYPGRIIYEHLPEGLRQEILFSEDQWDILENSDWEKNCRLLILIMIGGTCGQPHPGAEAEKRVKAYLEQGGQCTSVARIQRGILAMGLV